MNRPHYLLRSAAIVSSIVLVGGLVSYRAGALDRLAQNRSEPETSAAPAESQDTPLPQEKKSGDTKSEKLPWTYNWTPSTLTVGDPARPAAILYGPKSAPVFEPPPNTPATKPA